jgi:hypothetical protein
LVTNDLLPWGIDRHSHLLTKNSLYLYKGVEKCRIGHRLKTFSKNSVRECLFLLGVPAMVGRTFLLSDAPPGQAPQPVAVLTYQYWRRRLMQTLPLLAKHCASTIVATPFLASCLRALPGGTVIYLPLDTSDLSRQAFMTVFRLKRGVSKGQAMGKSIRSFNR